MSRKQNRLACTLVLLLLVVSGCTPKVTVLKNPGECDPGIRYYRPKPYLLVTPAGKTTSKITEEGTKTTVEETRIASGSDEAVQIELKYLPDFSEEYSINVRPGLGNADVKITLEDGWKLTSLNQVLDTKFADNLNAVTQAIGTAVGSAVKSGVPGPRAIPGEENPPSFKFVVCATNVPLGYYEAVIAEDPSNCDQRHMIGWQYVGFIPYPGCSAKTEPAGAGSGGGIYGLVFEHGVMTFRRLCNLGVGNSDRCYVPTGEFAKVGGGIIPCSDCQSQSIASEEGSPPTVRPVIPLDEIRGYDEN